MTVRIDQDLIGLPSTVLAKIEEAVAEARAAKMLSEHHMRTKCKACGNQVFVPCRNLTDEQRTMYPELHMIYGHVFTSWAESCGRCDDTLASRG